jgi:hypothetical protein
MSMHNAWQRDAVPATQPEWTLLPDTTPMGALGLTIAASSEVPRLLREVLENSGHYSGHVVAHAAICARAHSGSAVLAALGARLARSIAEPSGTT